jgi:hypothetical protein
MLLLRLLVIFSSIGCWQSCFAQDHIQAAAAIQVASQVSDGKYTLRGIVAAARENGIRVLVIADRDLMRWEYGIWPLGSILKRTVEHNSVFKYGIRRYLKEVKDLQAENPEMIIIPGAESAPFYYWQGSIFKNSFTLKDWHKHILTLGLEDPGAYQNIPVIGNKNGLTLPFSFKNLFLFWPLLILALGISCLGKRAYNYKDYSGKNLGPFSKSWQKFGIFLITIALLFLAQNYPFAYYLFDQYHGNLGVKPYQNFIDYTAKHGSLTYWLHPEAQNISKIGTVSIETKEYTQALLETHDYTGFAVFYDGDEKVGRPAGLWDMILSQYCQRKRDKPVWAIATLGFDTRGNLDQELKNLRTVLLLSSLNKQEVFNALREGRCYAVAGKDIQDFYLETFSVKDLASGQEKTMGQELALQGTPELRIKGNLLHRQGQVFKIKLIKDGSIIKTFEVPSIFDVTYQDSVDKGVSYYRIEIESPGLKAITNPIFVRKEKAR